MPYLNSRHFAPKPSVCAEPSWNTTCCMLPRAALAARARSDALDRWDARTRITCVGARRELRKTRSGACFLSFRLASARRGLRQEGPRLSELSEEQEEGEGEPRTIERPRVRARLAPPSKHRSNSAATKGRVDSRLGSHPVDGRRPLSNTHAAALIRKRIAAVGAPSPP